MFTCLRPLLRETLHEPHIGGRVVNIDAYITVARQAATSKQSSCTSCLAAVHNMAEPVTKINQASLRQLLTVLAAELFNNNVLNIAVQHNFIVGL